MFGSSRTKPVSVKQRKGLARHLEGWQPGLAAVFLALLGAMLSARPVPPEDLPEPLVAPRELEAVARADDALANAAERQPLDLDVRALGSAFRAYNLVDATDDVEGVGRERRAVAEAAQAARAHGDEALARLRAYELRSFLRELHRWEATGEESTELRELGGPFLSRARKNGWIEVHGHVDEGKGPFPRGARLIASDDVRAVLFKKRWTDLAMLRGPVFDPTSVEQRAFLGFVLKHPPREATSNIADPRDRIAARRAAEQGDQYRLKKIEELRAIDPAFPADLAAGVVLYRLRRFPLAAEMLGRFLDAHPNGPNVVRAQNYLLAARERAVEMF